MPTKPRLAPEKAKPGRYPFVVTLSGIVEASTLEEAQMKLDFALNEQEMRDRGITLLRTCPDVRSPLYGMFGF